MSKTRYDWPVYRRPTQTRYTGLGDVTGSIEISMKFKPAFTTEKRGPLAIAFVNMSTNRALLRSVSSIDRNNLLTKILGFVSNKPLQFKERPVIEFPVELSTPSFLNADLGEVFESEYRKRRLYNLLRDTVINVSHEPSFSTTNLSELPSSGSSAFGLQIGTQFCVPRSNFLNRLRIEESIIRTDCNVDNTPVNSEDSLFLDKLRSIRFKLAMQIKRILVLTERQRRRFDFPCQVWPVIFRDTKRGFYPTIGCGDSSIPRSQKDVDNPLIVSHRRILFTERFKLAFHRFQAFTCNSTRALYQRGWETGNRLSNIVIGGIVAVDLAGRFGVEAPFRASVKRHGIISHGFQEGHTRIRRNIQFQLNCPNHIHISALIDNILDGGDRRGGPHPTDKAAGFPCSQIMRCQDASV